jgi:uncharacterized protein
MGGIAMSTENFGTSTEYGTPGDSLSKDERMWGMLSHLSGVLGYMGVPFGNILGPLVVWLVKKEQYPFVDDQGKESLNFQITVFIAGVICFVLAFAIIGIPLGIALYIYALVVTIIAAVKANDGETYRYTINLRLIK